MTNVQKVFNKVIRKEFYTEKPSGSVLMCHALNKAFLSNTISWEDLQECKAEIQEYLGGFGSLGGMLDHKGLPFHFTARLAIYENWSNKPMFKK